MIKPALASLLVTSAASGKIRHKPDGLPVAQGEQVSGVPTAICALNSYQPCTIRVMPSAPTTIQMPKRISTCIYSDGRYTITPVGVQPKKDEEWNVTAITVNVMVQEDLGEHISWFNCWFVDSTWKTINVKITDEDPYAVVYLTDKTEITAADLKGVPYIDLRKGTPRKPKIKSKPLARPLLEEKPITDEELEQHLIQAGIKPYWVRGEKND